MPFFILLFLLIIIGNSQASSSASWNQHAKEVHDKCMAAAVHFNSAKPVGDMISYDDTVGFDALLIGGTYSQPHMKQRKGIVLCLFDRKNRTAYVVDADRLFLQ